MKRKLAKFFFDLGVRLGYEVRKVEIPIYFDKKIFNTMENIQEVGKKYRYTLSFWCDGVGTDFYQLDMGMPGTSFIPMNKEAK